jgi:CRISPR-associated protein Cmr3
MKIKIDAIDTLFFKDGKPFSMGEETWADGIFPPPPSVIYGAIRTAYFSEHPELLKLANSDEDPTKNLIVNEISFFYSDEVFYPIPRDYAKKKNKKENIAYRLKPLRNVNLSSSQLANHFLQSENEEVDSVDEAIISKSSLKRYLKGNEDKVSFRKLSEFVISEPKVGIGRDNNTHTSEEGKLYRVGLKRLSEKKEFEKEINAFSLIIDFSGLELPENGLIKLGAEGKIARYCITEVDSQTITDDELSKITENTFILYLDTPGLFKNGWKPDFENNSLLKKMDIEMLNASIGKPISIGGFDMKIKFPKSMKKAVPSGSVYFLKSRTKSFKEIFNSLNGKSISDYLANEGYGICHIGSLK